VNNHRNNEIWKSARNNKWKLINSIWKKLFIRNLINHLIAQKDLFNIMSVCFVVIESLKPKKKLN
jgi:hypothetical protein